MNPLVPPQTTYDAIERLVKKFKALPARERNALTPLLSPMRSPSEKQFPISNEVRPGGA